MNGKNEEDPHLSRFHKLPRPVRAIYARPRTAISIVVGIITYMLLPDSLRQITRLLISWDSAIGLYLILAFTSAFPSDLARIKRMAALQDDGRFLILMVTALGAFASIAAIVAELAAGHRGAPELILSTITVALSWATVHTTFALHYAHEYYRGGSSAGLKFPGDDEAPDYWDFVYFAFVIGMTAQVSDVGVTDKIIRRTALAHGVISFVFNTALVALMVNIAASAI